MHLRTNLLQEYIPLLPIKQKSGYFFINFMCFCCSYSESRPVFILLTRAIFFMIDKPRLDEMLVTSVLAGFERDMFTINKNGNSEKLLSIIWSPPASRNLNVF